MKIIVDNSKTTILNPDQSMISDLRNIFTYKDRSKEYQLNKMAKNPYSRNSKAYHQLKNEVSQCLLDESIKGQISFPSPLLYLTNLIPNEDNRKDTGKTIALPWATQNLRTCRPYQEESIDKALSNWRGIINIATGMGKSLVALNIIKKTKKKALIIAPSKGIAKQLYAEFCEHFGSNRVGFYGDGKKKLNDITVGIAQTVINHTDVFKKADLGLIIVDEAHRTASNTFSTILSELSDVGRIYGLTATAFRSDGKDLLLNAACGNILVEYDAKWGIENGFLAEPMFIVRKIKTSSPDYSDKLMAYKSHILSAKEISSRIEEDAVKMMKSGRSTLILVDSIEHGEALEKALGIPFARGDDKQSDEYVKQLNEGKVPGLIGTEGRIGEGVDTRNVDCLIMAQFTAAKGAVLQAVGRGLRKQGNKTHCFILDYWPVSSNMLSRHAKKRIEYYEEITSNVKVI